jgi:hypothetical protein
VTFPVDEEAQKTQPVGSTTDGKENIAGVGDHPSPTGTGMCTECSRVADTVKDCFRQYLQKDAVDSFYRNIGNIASLGSSISFGLIVSDSLVDPKTVSRHGNFDLSTVRILLALSWMLSIIVKIFSFTFAQLAPLRSPMRRKIESKFVYMLEIVAVLFLATAVSAYIEMLGYIGIGSMAIFGVFVPFSYVEV